MIVVVDVHYKTDYAKTVLVVFENWESENCSNIFEFNSYDVAEYTPGEFYKRELPCILNALNQIEMKNITAIIIDGYIYVSNDFKMGLGAYLYEALDKKIPIVGIAKTGFHGNTETVIPVYRGESKNPLFVSTIGTNIEQAAQGLKNMYGEFRLPYLLKLVDQKSKEA